MNFESRHSVSLQIAFGIMAIIFTMMLAVLPAGLIGLGCAALLVSLDHASWERAILLSCVPTSILAILSSYLLWKGLQPLWVGYVERIVWTLRYRKPKDLIIRFSVLRHGPSILLLVLLPYSCIHLVLHGSLPTFIVVANAALFVTTLWLASLEVRRSAMPALEVHASERQVINSVPGHVRLVELAEPPWHFEAMRRLRDLLVSAYSDTHAARYVALSAGVDIKRWNSAQAIQPAWNDLLRVTMRQKKLERLIQLALADADVAAYHPQLLIFLHTQILNDMEQRNDRR